MNPNIKRVVLFFIPALLILAGCVSTRPESGSGEKTWTYETVEGDPLNGRIYTLDNGLTVYLTVNRDEPRIQTLVAVRAGHKNDPADATGLAHYLEHMLFKGTDRYGTIDYEKEKSELDKIIALYDLHYRTTDSLERQRIYHQIDSISNVAATYAIPNEYTKMVTSMGAKGTNAYTWVEQTVYINDIPANQIQKWLILEAERFRNPVMRLFHTELETVYEEKNRSLDQDRSKVSETLFAGLFRKHPYGTQTTIGSVEHLKNPSLTKVIEYYNTYYVPNNMVMSLSGDFDPDKVIRMIDEQFGKLPPRPVPEFKAPVEDPITSPVVRDIYGPDAESVTIGYRLPGAHTPDADLLELVSGIIYNRTAGLIDLNLNQEQKVLGAYAYPMIFKDYSIYTMAGRPREGQSLEEVRQQLLSQIELVQQGDFPDWLLDAVRNDMKLQELKSYESNWSRAHAFVDAFVKFLPWEYVVQKHDRMAEYTKEDIIRFARRSFGENYVVINKHIGESEDVAKVKKPDITPIEINRDDVSEFAEQILSAPVPDIEPLFIDYDKDILKFRLDNGIQVLQVKNPENDLFKLYYAFDMGTVNDTGLGIALNYLQYLGTGDLTPAEVKQEFYKIGCKFNVFASEDQVWVSMSGLQDNFDQGISLFENLLADARPNPEALENMKQDILKIRADDKLSKDNILWGGLRNFGKYGSHSPFTHILPEDEVKNLQPEDLISRINSLNGYEHRILYYGPSEPKEIQASLEKYHRTPAVLKPVPPAEDFTELDTDATRIFVVDREMKQAEMILLSKGEKYNPLNAPERTMFNSYYGGSMSSVVFQTIREAKALAYSVFASYSNANKKDDPHYVFAYIGTQADKLPEAIDAMMDLLNNLPESEVAFESSKSSVLQKIQTDRTTRASILFNYLNAEKKGLDHDIRKDIYRGVQSMTMADVKAFHENYVKGRNYNILVMGKTDELDMDYLKSLGPVEYLTLEDIFGY